MIVISSRETGLISLVIKTHQAQHVVQPLAGDAKWDWRKMFQGPSVELFKVRCDLFCHCIKVKESNVKNSNHKKIEKRKKKINLGGNLSTYESIGVFSVIVNWVKTTQPESTLKPLHPHFRRKSTERYRIQKKKEKLLRIRAPADTFCNDFELKF